MALAFIYPHKLTEFLENELSEKLIASYRDDLDFQNLIDLVQQDFKCCGLSSEGYKAGDHKLASINYIYFQYLKIQKKGSIYVS